MKKLILVMVGAVLLASGVAEASNPLQIWRCEMNEGISESEVTTKLQEWLDAARKVEGGKNLGGWVRFPVAVSATGQTDVVVGMSAPTFAEWGTFWDNYPSSEAAQLEGRALTCPDSSLWEQHRMK